MKNKILITGASGFIGRYTIDEFIANAEQFTIYILVRKIADFPKSVVQIQCDDITNIDQVDIPWDEIAVVIHLAARAHVLKERVVDPLEEFRRVNRDATIKLANLCVASGVEQLVFLSSIGVLGNSSGLTPFSEETLESPHADYAVSKLEAEHAIKTICEKSNMTYTIIRPPLVIGSNAPGNFQLLLKLILKGIPLPFLFVKNKRSFIYCKNLANFIFVCAMHENAKNETFVIADEPAISTAQLVKELSKGLGKKLYLLPVPLWVLKFFSIIFSKKNTYIQLCESLEIDITKARTHLNWEPPYSFKEELPRILKNS